MRTVPKPSDYMDIDDYPGVQICDWKEHPDTTLSAVDNLLKDHGLEIVVLDTGDDAYHFKIEKRI